MGRLTTVSVVGALLACGPGQRSESSAAPKPVGNQEAAALDDSVHLLVRAYETGALGLDPATEALADLVEPLTGVTYQSGASARATELFEATGRELQRRHAVRFGLPDSLRAE